MEKENSENTTRETIIQTYWQLMLKNKRVAIPISTIIKKAGYNRSTFYEYFPDADRLLETAEDEILLAISKNLDSSLEEKRIDNSIEVIAQTYKKYAKQLSFLLGLHGDPRFFDKLKNKIVPDLNKYFKIKRMSYDTTYKIDFALSGIVNVLVNWYNDGEKISADHLVVLFRGILRNGLQIELINKGKDA